MQSPLRNVRKAHGFTLQHVAAGVQVNPATLSRIERLEQIPSIELAERLANFFKGEVSEMQILYPARFQSSQNQNGFKPQETLLFQLMILLPVLWALILEVPTELKSDLLTLLLQQIQFTGWLWGINYGKDILF